MQSRTTYLKRENVSPVAIPATDTHSPLAVHKGSFFAYLASVLSNLAQELSRYSKKERNCALCSDPILPTHLAAEDQEEPVHAICLEMKSRKGSLLQSVKSEPQACSLCGESVLPTAVYFHEAGLTVSYACAEPAHDEPNRFCLPVTTGESKRIGTWEARLRDRLKEKGYVRCCECGRQIRTADALLLGNGWYYCGCLPELWRSGP